MTNAILFSLLRTAVGSGTAEDRKFTDLTGDSLANVYALAKRHDMAHLIAGALDKLGVRYGGDLAQALHKRMLQAVFRCARQQEEFEKIAHLFETKQIPFVPLKGTVIREWYPEPWMRTSTDIDILVRKEDLDVCIRLLSDQLGYKHQGTAFHDASLYTPSGVHLELHYELADTTAPEKVRRILLDVWDHVSPAEGSACCHFMDADWFYLYHIFHMAKHLYTGGCGIKPFLDLWIMKKEKGYCAQSYHALLDSCGLLTVAMAAEKLVQAWFSGSDLDDLSRRLAMFVLDGGVHGTVDGNAAVNQARKGGRFRSLWQKIFLPYDIMKELYPILNNHKWLLPGAEILRWLKLLFGGNMGRTASILRKNIAVSEDSRENAGRLLRDLDLM